MIPRRIDAQAKIAIAQVAHEANRVYCVTLGDNSQPAWHDAPDWQQVSAIKGVLAIIEGRVTAPEHSHISWAAEKQRDGWKYGAVKDPDKKEHPCLVPFEELPVEQQLKDYLFFAVVTALIGGHP